MDEEIINKLENLQDYIEEASNNIFYASETLNDVFYKLNKKNNTSIEDIDNFKRELKREGLYSKKFEEFLENYIKYYNY